MGIAFDPLFEIHMQVFALKWTGKIDYHFGRVTGHNGPVSDLKWNPFNDNILATASEDATVHSFQKNRQKSISYAD
jgi:WD40 repeat protein